MNILITICARKGSKRLPNKNIKPFCGKPLMEWTIEQTERFDDSVKDDVDIIVCSDYSREILMEFAWGQFVYGRPERLNGDNISKLDVIRYAVERLEEHFETKYDVVIDLDVTAPCRLPDDIEKAYQQFLEKKPPTLFSVVPARRQPWFNQVFKNGLSEIITLVSDETAKLFSIQGFDLNAAIYIYDRKWLDLGHISPICRDSGLYIMQDWQGIDIDYQWEFDVCEYLFKKYILERQ